MSERLVLHAWRHPRPIGAEGRCIGRSDLAVDPRRARRLARRIARLAVRHQLPRIVVTSPLRRCADVGRHLRRLGWRHRIDPALLELDFGRWDGRRWADIAPPAIAAWAEDLFNHAPGGGEPLSALLERAAKWRPDGACVIVGHAGWMTAREWLATHAAEPPTAASWPAPPACGGHFAWVMGG